MPKTKLAKPMSFEQYAAKHKLTSDAEVDGHIHAGLRSAPTTKTYKKFYQATLKKLQDERAAAKQNYHEAITRGEVRDFTRDEKLAMTANGHPDNPAVQAAKRILEKRADRVKAAASGLNALTPKGPKPMSKLSVRRAKDRTKMAGMVATILRQADNANVEIEPDYFGPRTVSVNFEHALGMRVRVSFEADDRQDQSGQFCMAWNISGKWDANEVWQPATAKISDKFGIAMQALVNSFHGQKCTAFSDNFEDLCAKLQRAVTMLNDGTAYAAVTKPHTPPDVCGHETRKARTLPPTGHGADDEINP